MKKIIILLCFLLVAIGVSAQKLIRLKKYNQVELAVCTDYTSNNNQAVYGLCKNGKKLLPARYEFIYNEDLEMFVFYAKDQIYLFDTFGKKLFEGQIDFQIDKDSSVEFVPIKLRNDVPCYELMVYFFNNLWGGQSFGTFYSKGGHIYRILRPKAELMN